MVALRQQRSLDNAGVLGGKLAKDLRSTWKNSKEELKTLFGFASWTIGHAPMSAFTALNKHRKGRGLLALSRTRLHPQNRA